MTFTIDDAQRTYEGDTNGKKCLLVEFAQHQVRTKMASNFMQFQKHSYNLTIVQPLVRYITNPTLLPEDMTASLRFTNLAGRDV